MHMLLAFEIAVGMLHYDVSVADLTSKPEFTTMQCNAMSRLKKKDALGCRLEVCK